MTVTTDVDPDAMAPAIVSPSAARTAFAALALDEREPARVLGDIALRPHQVDAVERLRAAITAHGGALLADAVGLGKTYVALALAREFGETLVVAPAALRAMWRDAATRAGVGRVAFVSFESLSRGCVPPGAPALLIVDEAHHVRSRQTIRFRALAALASRGMPLVLLSATPVHNRESDLAAILSLFLGERAFRVGLAALQRHVIRRAAGDVGGAAAPPRVAPPIPLELPADDDLLDAIAAIPPAVPPSDGGTAHALCTLSLVRAWASSDAALVFTLRRRLAIARALQAGFDEGHYPSRHALSAWTVGTDAVQLAFPSLVAAPAADGTPLDALRDAVAQHADALRDLLARLNSAGARDAARSGHLARLLVDPSRRILAFSHSAETVYALFRHLRAAPGVCALTGHGAEVAGGRLSRAEAIARFAPRASGAREPDRANAIRLLIATDLLSEGLNLQDAGVVVHLDLPWTAARLEQRVGRVARPGAIHDRVDVYAMAAPASSAAALRVESRLRAKLDLASHAIGAPSIGALLPQADQAVARMSSDVEVREQIRAALERWRGDAADARSSRGFVVAAIAAECSGWVAVARPARRTGEPLLVANIGDGPTTAPDAILRAIAGANSGGAASPTGVDHACAALARWLAEREGALVADAGAVADAPIRQAALRRIARILDTAPAFRRAALAAQGAVARTVVGDRHGAQRDAALTALARETNDERWLSAVAALGRRTVGGPATPSIPAPDQLDVVLLVLCGPLAIFHNNFAYK